MRNPKFLSLTEIEKSFEARVRNERQEMEKQIETWKTTKRERERENDREDSISWQDEKKRATAKRSPPFFFFLPSRSVRRRQGWLPPLLSDGVRSCIAAGANCDYGFRVSPADFTSESRVGLIPLPSPSTLRHPPFEPFPHCPVFAARLKNESSDDWAV